MIRYHTEADIPQILELQRSEFTGKDEDILEAIRAGHCWVDSSPGSTLINGYVIVTYPNDVPYVYSVAVAKDMRGSGIGTGLMNTAHQNSRGLNHRKIWLKTTVDNPAQKLYFDLGYRIDGYDAELYGYCMPGITMTKRFAFGN